MVWRAALAGVAAVLTVRALLTTSNIYIAYFRYVCRHKWWVGLFCLSMRMPWRALTHDLSKFRPSEFLPYARYFFSPPDVARSREARQAFELAWRWHYTRNRHHWEHWVITRDGRSGVVARSMGTIAYAMGPTIGVERMTAADMQEMLADWLGMSKTLRTPGHVVDNVRNWYLTKRDDMVLHPDVRAFVDSELQIPKIREQGWRDPTVIYRSQLAPAFALGDNEQVVAPGGRHGVFIGYAHGKAVVRLNHSGRLQHFNERDLQRVEQRQPV